MDYADRRYALRIRSARRRGFTLVEVLIALVVSAIVVFGARTLLELLGSQALRVSESAREADADANGERLLRALVARAEVPSKLDSTFGGDEQSAHFASWCEVPRGWLERCRVVLRVEQHETGVSLSARLSTGPTILVRRARTAVSLRYLVDARDGGRWLRRWPSETVVPLAVGVLIDGDTMIVRVGERG